MPISASSSWDSAVISAADSFDGPASTPFFFFRAPEVGVGLARPLDARLVAPSVVAHALLLLASSSPSFHSTDSSNSSKSARFCRRSRWSAYAVLLVEQRRLDISLANTAPPTAIRAAGVGSAGASGSAAAFPFPWPPSPCPVPFGDFGSTSIADDDDDAAAASLAGGASAPKSSFRLSPLKKSVLKLPACTTTESRSRFWFAFRRMFSSTFDSETRR